MYRRGLRELLIVAAALGMSASVRAESADVPRGRRTVRPAPTHVVVRPVDLDAQGALARLAPGVGLVVAGARAGTPVAGTVTATVAGAVAVTGRIDAAALGARIAADTELRAPDGGAGIGRAHVGALVVVVGHGAGGTICETVGPVRARVLVPTDALTAEPRELVYPVAKEKLVAVAAPAELAAARAGKPIARLERGARLTVLDGYAGWAHVRSYGAFEIEGFVRRERLVAPDGAPPGDDEAPASKGLTPTHEALVDTPAFADAAGRRPVGVLRGGTLVTVGVEVSGARTKVMTSGDVVVELWVPQAGLRSLEPDIWSERN